MAGKDDSTPLRRGVGSVSRDFTAPQANVVTPGLNRKAQPTEAERFRDAMFSFGKGVVSAAQGRANINNQIKALKETSVRKVERDLNRHAAAFQTQRLQKADQVRRQILEDSDWRGPEWAERELRSRMLNAPSQEESAVFERSWKPANASIERNNAEAYRQKFNSAKMAVQQTGLQLTAQMNEDPALKATLIGDGESMGRRVQDWVLSEIAAASDLDGLEEEDADVLTHNAIVFAAGVTETLRSEHVKEVEQSNLYNGSRQMEADTIATLMGDQTVGDLGVQFGWNLTTHFSHLTPEQQIETVRTSLRKSIDSIATGQYGINAADNIRRVDELSKITVDGGYVFNEEEQTALKAAALQRGTKTVAAKSTAAIAAIEEGTYMPVPTGDGVVYIPSAGNMAALMDRDENGMNAYDREEANILRELNLSGLENPTPEESLLIKTVRDTFTKSMVGAAKKQIKEDKDRNSYRTYHTGGVVENANDAHRGNPFFKMRLTSGELQEIDRPPNNVDDISFLKESVAQFIPEGHPAHATLNGWQGQPIEFTEENAEINRFFAMAEAFQYETSGGIQRNGFPKERAEYFMAQLQGNEWEVQAALEFATSMKTGANHGLDALIDQASGVSPNAEAAILYARTAYRLGQFGTDSGAGVDPAQMRSNVRAIMNARDINKWLTQAPNDYTSSEQYRSEGSDIANAFAAVIESDFNEGVFNRDGNISTQVNNYIMSDSNGVGRNIRVLAGALKAANPSMDAPTIASLIYQSIRRDGYRARSVNGKMNLIQDPYGYVGGGDHSTVEAHIEHTMNRPFTGEYRAYLGEVLGIDNANIPQNMMQLGMYANKDMRKLLDPLNSPTGNQLKYLWNSSNDPDVRGSLMAPPEQFGGAIIDFKMHNDVQLALYSKKDGTFTTRNGAEVIIPAGQSLFKINPLMFTPDSEYSITTDPLDDYDAWTNVSG